MKKLKIGLAASAGGHLNELLPLKDSWAGYEHFFVSDNRVNAMELGKKEKVHFVIVPRRNPFRLLLNVFQALKIYLKEKPQIVITTGADVAVPFCLIAKLFGAKVVFIESFAQIYKPSLSGEIMYRFADKFYIQWEENKKFFPKGIFKGRVF